MKTSLRNTVALVLAVLAGTFVSVRGYLDAYAAPQAMPGTTVTRPGLLLTTFPLPAYLRPAPAPTPAAEEVSRPDDNCPTC
ncbi:MAG: hypothetical protein ACI8QZ_000842 [Chlamydiales bacterium]|jgi:hypothetical protein